MIDLADLVDSERARVIALSASELARSTCTVEASPVPALSSAAPAAIVSAPPTSSVVPSASPEPPTARSAPSERADAAPSTLRLDLGASLETAVFAAYASALVGGRASVGATSTSLPWLRGAMEGFALGGAARDPLGNVSLQTYGGALSLAVRGEGKGVRGELGPRVDVGGIRASGAPLDASASGSTAHALLVLPSVTARVLLPLRAALSMMLSISVGHTLVGQRVHADARTAAGIAGPYLSLGVGLQSEL